MNSETFIKEIARHQGRNRRKVKDDVYATFEVLARLLAAGEKVIIPNVGTFETKDLPARRARNPHTGQTVQVEAKRVARFRPTGRLKTMVRDGDTTASIRKPGNRPADPVD